MSHFTTIQTQIKDIAALESACAELGLSLAPNAEARGFAGNRHRGDYVIQLKGPYDIALVREGNHYNLVADQWEGHVEREVGPNFGRLLQLYAVHKTLREAHKKGLTIHRSILKNGTIKLSLGRPG